MQELKDRLKIARKNRNLTQFDIVNHIDGLTQSAYSQLESGKVKSSSKILEIAQLLKVDPHWLTTGQGEMANIDLPSIKNTVSIHTDDVVASTATTSKPNTTPNSNHHLIAQAAAITGLDEKQTIEQALQFFIAMNAQKDLRQLRGKLHWRSNLT